MAVCPRSDINPEQHLGCFFGSVFIPETTPGSIVASSAKPPASPPTNPPANLPVNLPVNLSGRLPSGSSSEPSAGSSSEPSAGLSSGSPSFFDHPRGKIEKPLAQASAFTRLSYDKWYGTAQGSVALAAQKRLLRRMLVPWTNKGEDKYPDRRGASFLELFCGSGFFLEELCQAGFNVSGQEQDQTLALGARNRLGNKVDITLSNPEQLPFNDQSFDYVACVNGLEFAQDAENILREAMRLAAYGVLIAFPNPWSLRGVENLGKKRKKIDCLQAVPYGVYKTFSPVAIWSLFRKLDTRARLAWGSILLGPGCTWKDRGLCRKLNMFSLPISLGACVMLRLDFAPSLTGTPLLLSGGRN